MKEKILQLLAEKNISDEKKTYFIENIDNFDDFQLNLVYDTLIAKSDEDFWVVINKNNQKIDEMRVDLKKSTHDAKRELYIRAEEEVDKNKESELEELLRQI